MKRLCSILGVVGIVSVIGSQMACSCYRAFTESVNKNNCTQSEYQSYLDNLEDINKYTNGVSESDIQKSIDKIKESDINNIGETNNSDIQDKLNATYKNCGDDAINVIE